jgi:hypothetical protein
MQRARHKVIVELLLVAFSLTSFGQVYTQQVLMSVWDLSPTQRAAVWAAMSNATPVTGATFTPSSSHAGFAPLFFLVGGILCFLAVLFWRLKTKKVV